ncbi:hypothetical protein ABG067_002074 [Albugo candida]
MMRLKIIRQAQSPNDNILTPAKMFTGIMEIMAEQSVRSYNKILAKTRPNDEYHYHGVNTYEFAGY